MIKRNIYLSSALLAAAAGFALIQAAEGIHAQTLVEGNQNPAVEEHQDQPSQAIEAASLFQSQQEAGPSYQIGQDDVYLSQEAGTEYIYQAEPNRIVTTLTEAPSQSMAFNWYQSELDPEAQVFISESKDLSQGFTVPAEVSKVTSNYFLRNPDGYIVYGADADEDGQVDGYFTEAQISPDNYQWMGGLGPDYGEATPIKVHEYVYKAKADDLKPGTRYYYAVGNPKQMSALGTFKTDDLDPRLVFIQYTDTQNAYWIEKVHNQSQYGANTLKRAISLAEDQWGGADFAVHNGDVVEFNWSEDEWYDLMNQSQDSYLALPHVVAPGNHDGMEFLNHFNTPSADGQRIEGSYYSFDYGPVHFTVVNTNENGETTDPDHRKSKPMMSDQQIEWLKQDLAQSQADWKIVIAHKPLYSAGFNSLQQPDMTMIRGGLLQILEDYGVDLVMTGHAHSTAITKPLVYDATAFAEARPTDDRLMVDGRIYYTNPEGTIFFLPNLASPDAIDATLARDFEGIQATAGFLGLTDQMTEDQLAYYQSLFTAMEQPASSSSTTLFGNHDSTTTNFALYEVNGNRLTVNLYQIDGHLDRNEQRIISLTHQLVIEKEEPADPAMTSPSSQFKPAKTQTIKQDSTVAAASSTQVSGDKQKDEIRSDSSSQTTSLPQTGATSLGLGLATTSILSGLGLLVRKKHNRL